ncbi:MAG: PAS domain S-box protein [Chloroflexi bacterium]|uniref:histidine kinase n=1 Tax=Candidatus Chlorohelix allophototropha TaxID=3003348 RepID=A0A8T7M979_9CHLR|nr:PAS domain S-box protein [Chloroflexota bacterium]WJW68531.1 PAS domain S-box protein [Chloroflexota bacterium L227-S17]
MPHLPVATNPDATYSDIFNSAPTSMFIINRDFTLAALNNRATERTKLALGYVPTLGIDVRPILAKIGITNFEKHLLEAYAGKLITLEQPYNNPEVSWKWLEINYIPVKNPEGLIFTVCFSVLDISRRKYAEEALAKSVSINLALIKAIPDILLRIDRNGNFVNYQAETTSNSSVDATLQAKLVENALAYIELTLNSGKTQVFDSELEVEGNHRFFETRLLMNTENEVLAIVRDVTERKTVERTLLESEQRYRLLAENTIDIVVALSKDGEYLYASPSCEKVLGYTSEELKQHWEQELVHPDELPLMAAAIKYNRLTRANYETVVIRLRHKQGHYLWFEIGGQMGFSEKTGEAENIIVTLRDVTARKSAEAALQFRHDYEKLVANISSNLMRASFENIDTEINFALATIGQFLGVDRCQIYYYSNVENEIFRNYEWCEEGITALGVGSKHSADLWAIERIKNGEVIRLDSLADLPEEASSFRALLEKAVIQSMVQLPMRVDHGVIGFINFETITRQKVWSDDDIVLLRVIAEVFASAFKRRETEHALIEQRDFARLVMDNMGHGLAVSWKVENLEYINPALAQMTGFSVEEMRGKTPLDYTHPDDHKVLLEARWQWLNGKTTTNEVRMITKDGSEKFVSITGTPFFNNDKLEGVIAVITDLTERRKAEEALRNSEQLLRTVVSNAPLILFAFDTNGKLTFVDGKGLSYFNIDPKMLVGQHAPSVRTDISKYLLDKFTGLVTRALHGEIVQSVTKIGERYFEGVYTPVRDTEGRITGVICVSFDVTQRVIAEEELTKNLKTERELSQQKSLFITTASHEFRTPLTIINSSAQLLEYYGHKWTDERKQELYQRIYLSVVNMTELLDDVLLLNKADAGKLEFNPVEMDFSQFCATMLEEIQLGIGTKHQFDLQIEPAPVLLQGDSKLLRQIISNLLTNAIKYSAEGSTVHFRLGYETNQVSVEIEDEGIGIPPEGLKHLFDVFYRAKNVSSIEGTGLGMPIVKKCLDTHKGRIEVESELNKGTLYRVWIPLG